MLEALLALAGGYALGSIPFAFEPNARKLFEMRVEGNTLAFSIDGQPLVTATDGEYLSGGAGFLIEGGTVPARGYTVRRIGG